MLLQLIAYSKSGKDTLYQNLPNLKSLGWIIYGSSDQSANDFKLPIENTCRIAFADVLKMMVCKDRGMDKIDDPSTVHTLITVKQKMTAEEWLNGGWLDILKDIPADEVNLPLDGKTFRRWLIDYGWEKKSQVSLTFFVDLVRDDVADKLSKGISVYITDTRYPYEVIDGATTIRLFRSDVPIADESEHSERSMDNYKCSYVFCKNDADFLKLKELQPQYHDYIKYGPIM